MEENESFTEVVIITTQDPARKFNTDDIFALVFFSIMTLAGTIGNLILISTLVLTKLLWKPVSFYTINLCLADLMLCAIYAPYCINAITQDNWTYGCEALGVFMNIAQMVSFLTLAATGFNRYMLVKLSERQYSIWYSNQRTVLSILALWGIVIACNMPLLLGYGVMGYDDKARICTISFQDEDTFVYDLLVTILVGIPSFILTITCYICIGRKFYHRARSVNSLTSRQRPTQHSRDNYRLSRNLFVLTALFTICWAPTMLKVFYDSGELPEVFYQVIIYLALSHAIVHPYMYICVNSLLHSMLVHRIHSAAHEARRLSHITMETRPWSRQHSIATITITEHTQQTV